MLQGCAGCAGWLRRECVCVEEELLGHGAGDEQPQRERGREMEGGRREEEERPAMQLLLLLLHGDK